MDEFMLSIAVKNGAWHSKAPHSTTPTKPMILLIVLPVPPCLCYRGWLRWMQNNINWFPWGFWYIRGNGTKSAQNLIYLHFPCSDVMVEYTLQCLCLSNAVRFLIVDDDSSLLVHFDSVFAKCRVEVGCWPKYNFTTFCYHVAGWWWSSWNWHEVKL